MKEAAEAPVQPKADTQGAPKADTQGAPKADTQDAPKADTQDVPEVDAAVAPKADADVEAGPGTAEASEPTAPDAAVQTQPVAVEAADAADPASDAAETDESDDSDEDDDDASGNKDDATSRDASIESVADDDTHDDIRPVRKPRARRYKIQEVIKVRQIMLVQVVKEERGNKGAALTTYLSLAGRYCVLMPNTARGGGISRKITNAADRSKLKEIATGIDVPKGAGLIIRTAGAKRTKTEIKRDYEYLQRLWEQIRALTLQSIAPAKIYEEGDLIKRSIRDLYSREIDEVLVEGERGYRVAKDFMKMIMPSHAKNVQHYQDQMPLFARFQVESYLGAMFNPTVQLKSGGYIVIGVTEALVAIDVNSGRATKEGSIEETATKTNLEAAEEVARQLRLRDLAGLIVIDFIDMDERKNNAAVEKKIKDKLKTDRARIQVGRISGFGLLEMSRQRLRPGMIEATTQPCTACHGTGLIRSDDNLALQVLRQIEEEGVRRRSREVLVKCPVGIANYLMNQKREHILQIETRYGMSVRIEGDPHLISPDFTLEKFKTATRVVPEATTAVVSVDTSLMDRVDEDAADDIEDAEVIDVTPETVPEAESEAAPQPDETGEEDGKPKKRRRRRRRKSKSKEAGENGEDYVSDGELPEQSDAAPVAESAEAASSEAPESADDAPKPKRTRTRSRRSRSKTSETAPESMETAAPVEAAPAGATSEPVVETETPVTETALADGSVAETPVAETPVAETPVTETSADVPDVDAPADVAPVIEHPVADAKVASVPEVPTETPVAPTDEKPKRVRRKAADVIAAAVGAPVVETPEPVDATDQATHDMAAAVDEQPPEETSESAQADHAPEPVTVVEADQEPTAPAGDKPKRRGWWSLGS